MDEERSRFLNDRLSRLAEEQPKILVLRDKLLEVGGTHLVAPAEPDPDLEELLLRGFATEGEVNFEEMAENSCHWNVAALWLQKKHELAAIATGYALSDDGLWRQHSWGIQQDAILETTEPRRRYFGVRMEGTEASSFASRFFTE
jgi:hypothetical protein